MSETRNDIDFARLRAAVREVNENWDVERDGPIFRFEAQAADLQPPGAASSTNPDPYAHLYNAQTRDLLAESQRQIEQSDLYRRVFDTQERYVPGAPAPYLAESQHRLDILDEKFRAQKRLIYVQIVLLVLWVILQAVSILQRMGKFG